MTFEVLEEIARVNNDLGLTIKETVKGAAAMGGGAGAGAITGALIGGPIGMFVGGAIGYALGTGVAYKNMKTFKSLREVLKELNDEDKKKMLEIAIRILEERGIILATQIVGHYGSETARDFLVLVYEGFSGKRLEQ